MSAASPDPATPRMAPAPIGPFIGRPRFQAAPVSLTPLIGRDQEAAAAGALRRRGDVRVLTLTGPGGVGKTTLALQLAAALNDHFAGRVAWIPLASIRDPDAVVAAIATALGVDDGGDHAQLDGVKSALSHARCLLLLDNFEQVLDAAPHVAELLSACPPLTVLVTSRSRLRLSGEHALPVPPLPLPDERGAPSLPRIGRAAAVQLFVARAQAAAPAFALTEATAPLVADICRRLDGLPLAIELAAARVAHLPLDDVRNRLERRLPLLVGGARDLPARLRTMHDAIAWSYDLLPLAERALLARLAVFAGGFTLDAVERVMGDGSWGVGDEGINARPPSPITHPLPSLTL